MTGYGKSVVQLPTKKISIEIKSLNSKNLDLNTRMPSTYREKELSIRKRIASKLIRGKVDFSLYIESTGEETSTQINTTLVKQYIEQLKAVVNNADETEYLKMAVRMPDALTTEREEIDEQEWNEISKVIDLSLDKTIEYRLDEGMTLETDFIGRIKSISNLLDEVITMDPDRIDSVRERLTKGISDIKEKVDDNRFEQELVYYIEKFDITEEKSTLRKSFGVFPKGLTV
jgi:uncharacterized protein (TIGR00255 family)